MKTLVLGTVLGGLVSFVWGAISWSVMAWHHKTFKAFKDEEAVARVLLDNAPMDAVYGLPAPPVRRPGMTKQDEAAADAAVVERMRTGPLALVVFERSGYASIKGKLVGALLIGMVSSLLFTLLLQQFAAGHSYLARVMFVTLGALAGAILCRVTDWNWHGYSTPYAAVAVADVAVGWFLVGLALAWVTRTG